jgi:hypothetical protein
VLVEGEGVASVVDTEGDGVTVVAGGVVVVGVGGVVTDGVGGVVFNWPSTFPQPTVSTSISFFEVSPLTSAVLLKELPIFRPSGDLSSV